MKKLTSILALVICVIMLAGVVCAAADTTTPSVQAKEAPEVEKVVITDASGAETELADTSVEVTSYAAAKSDSSVPAEVKQQVEEAYKEITSTENLGTLTKDLDKAAKEIKDNYTANVFVVTDVFDVTPSEEIKTALKNGGSVSLTFDTNYTDKPVVLHRNSETGKWEVIDSSKVTLKNGKVTVEFTSLSPVAFLAVDSAKAAQEPTTPAKSNTWIWIVVIIVVVLVIVLIVLLKGKKSDDGEAATEETKEETTEETPAEEATEETTEEAPAEETTEEAPAEEAPAEEAPAEEAPAEEETKTEE